MSSPKNERPQIEYPCPWDYKIIGTCEETLRGAVHECLASALHHEPNEREFELGMSRTSEGGKFVSLRLNLMVLDEAERNSIFATLANHPDVRIVI